VLESAAEQAAAADRLSFSILLLGSSLGRPLSFIVRRRRGGGPMKCVVLQNADGAHLGFMLCSPDLGQPAGDCVFVAVPGQAELFDTPAAGLLFERREAGESSWQVASREPLSVVVRTPGLPAEMFVELGSGGAGQWGVGSGSGRQVVGRALLPPSAEPGAAPDRGRRAGPGR